MKELALHLLDIAENSIKAGADLIQLTISEKDNSRIMVVEDNGCGMKPDFLQHVTDPFCTTRTTRKVGLGLPLLRLAAEQTGGYLTVESRNREDFPDNHGTCVTACFHTDHIDCVPPGDMASTVWTLIQGAPKVDFVFLHKTPVCTVRLDTRAVRRELGKDIPINAPAVLEWIADFLHEQYAQSDA
jgi:hypothetical protein